MDWLDIKEFIKDMLKYFICIIIIFIIALYVVGLQQIVGNSMEPTLKNGDVIVINKLSDNYKRGDIVSLYHDDTKYIIKRIIGLPGESVEIKDSKIYINGKVIKDYIENTNMINFSLSKLGYDKIPEDMYFVMGDNRNYSFDSRMIGLIPKEDIVGKKVIRIWPLFTKKSRR